ncbi:hypothetical protein PVOR_03630 [Paenibacillus vortex V453]|uniref:Uncharacterized protein n=1 Tax=Paenibacillus vortex V453 TaxID=715225 RepID=A0A2R9T1A0_9BACL|nr:hypothetical protein [Paenibacillus vortex]EFU43413.1 hypothetical protein PVOR_03630 [Paenibacillus vortex V453]
MNHEYLNQTGTQALQAFWRCKEAFLKLFPNPGFREPYPSFSLSFNLPFWTRIFISFPSQLNQSFSSFSALKPDMTETGIFIPELLERHCGARD